MDCFEHGHDIDEYVFVDIKNIQECDGSENKDWSIADDDESFDLCDEEMVDDLSQCPSASASLCSETLFQLTEHGVSKTNEVNENQMHIDSFPVRSRLSNKKRRKQIKKMKKAEAAAVAAAALASREKLKALDVPRGPKKKITSSSKGCKINNIAVMCATQSYAEFRDECNAKN